MPCSDFVKKNHCYIFGNSFQCCLYHNCNENFDLCHWRLPCPQMYMQSMQNFEQLQFHIFACWSVLWINFSFNLVRRGGDLVPCKNQAHFKNSQGAFQIGFKFQNYMDKVLRSRDCIFLSWNFSCFFIFALYYALPSLLLTPSPFSLETQRFNVYRFNILALYLVFWAHLASSSVCQILFVNGEASLESASRRLSVFLDLAITFCMQILLLWHLASM